MIKIIFDYDKMIKRYILSFINFIKTARFAF